MSQPIPALVLSPHNLEVELHLEGELDDSPESTAVLQMWFDHCNALRPKILSPRMLVWVGNILVTKTGADLWDSLVNKYKVAPIYRDGRAGEPCILSPIKAATAEEREAVIASYHLNEAAARAARINARRRDYVPPPSDYDIPLRPPWDKALASGQQTWRQ